jgi:sensor histidine kinase YesM
MYIRLIDERASETPIMSKIYKIAILSSPLIALYGVMPVYLFGFISLNEILPFYLGFTCFIFFGWVINIFVISFTKNNARWVRYTMSYFFALLLHFSIILIGVLTNGLPDLKGDFLVAFYPIISVMAFNTVSLLIINLLVSQEKSKNAEIEVQKLTVSSLETEKKVLQQQLQPHFLFNSLSTLKSLIKENPDEAENYTIKLSEFLRFSIDAHKAELVTLNEELEFTKGYIELQKARFPNSFFCTIEVSENLLERKIPAFGLQTLVENAIKHNQFTTKKPLNIHIESLENVISVSNNKMPRHSYTPSTGTGLSNLNKRYELISGKGIIVKDGELVFEVKLDLL